MAISYRDPAYATAISVLTYPYNTQQQWNLTARDAITVPEHAGTIVEVNGRRLTPPMTYYTTMTYDLPYMVLPFDPRTATVQLYANGVLYDHPITVCTGISVTSKYRYHVVLPDAPPPLPGQFVFYENFLIALDPDFMGDVALVIQSSLALPAADYTVVDGQLTITTPLVSSDLITVTTFKHANTMGTKTVVYPYSTALWNSDGYGNFECSSQIIPAPIPLPILPHYLLATLNGVELI